MDFYKELKNILEKSYNQLSDKLLYFKTYIDIENYKIKFISNIEESIYKDSGIDCVNNIIYINRNLIDFNKMILDIEDIELLNKLFKHELLHAYLYNITDISLKQLVLDTSYFFILLCVATDANISSFSKETIYYKDVYTVESIIKKNPEVIESTFFIMNSAKNRKNNILSTINSIAENELFNLCFEDCEKKNIYNNIDVYKKVEAINNLIIAIYNSLVNNSSHKFGYA